MPLEQGYINIHSHRKPQLPDEWVLRNAYTCIPSVAPAYALSAGIHPWYIPGYGLPELFSRLEKLADHPSVLAIGECGLDRSITINMALQKKVFEFQLRLAHDHHKPVIIHAVRSYSDLLPYLKASTVPWVFHHYQGNVLQTCEMLRYPAYFSFGKSLSDPTEKTKTVLKELDLNRLFLETDTMPVTIAQVYSQAARLRDVPLAVLRQQILQNRQELFAASR